MAKHWEVEIIDPETGRTELRRVAAKDEFAARVLVEDAGKSVAGVRRARGGSDAPELAIEQAGQGARRGGAAIALGWIAIVLAIVMPVLGLPLGVVAIVSGARARAATGGASGTHALTVGIVATVLSCLAMVGWAMKLLNAVPPAP